MNLENHKGKRKAGALKGKIWTAEDCLDPENETIHAIEVSEIFPESNEVDSHFSMTGKGFVEKWPGVIKDANVNNLRESKLDEKLNHDKN